MRAAILCPGPSLLRSFNADLRPQFDLMVGVNAAAQEFPCDWWVALDSVAFMRYPPIGLPNVVVFRGVLNELNAGETGDRFRRHSYIDHEQLIRETGIPSHCRRFTVCLALALAVREGATSVTMFGHDMAGSDDHRGRTCKGRNPKRWANERPLWAEAVAWARGKGVEVVHGHD